MKNETFKIRLKRGFRSLFRSMDFVADHFRPGRRISKKAAARFMEIYQKLGMAWEFLGLQCKHWDGYRRTREGKYACRLCGKIKGTDEFWLLLPRTGPKQIGRMARPNSDETFPNKKKALIVGDTIRFHGATLAVKVHNAYKSRWPGGRGHDGINIAADRTIELREGQVECWLDTHLVHVRWKPRPGAKRRPSYGGFVWELSRKRLKNFPILVDYDGRGRFEGLTILRAPTR
jgi:hypothetical protein